MAKSKHTHKGHCQLCGRVQALDNNTRAVAKHGYTVEYSYFVGVCPGSGHLPLERERFETDKLTAQLVKEAAELDKRVMDLHLGKVLPEVIETNRVKFIGKKAVPVTIPFAEGDEWQKREEIRRCEYRASHRAAQLRRYCNHLYDLIAKVHGKDYIKAEHPNPVTVAPGVKFTHQGVDWEIAQLFQRGYSRTGRANWVKARNAKTDEPGYFTIRAVQKILKG